MQFEIKVRPGMGWRAHDHIERRELVPRACFATACYCRRDRVSMGIDCTESEAVCFSPAARSVWKLFCAACPHPSYHTICSLIFLSVAVSASNLRATTYLRCYGGSCMGSGLVHVVRGLVLGAPISPSTHSAVSRLQ